MFALVFLVSKVWPSHVAGDGVMRACEASLERLGTDHLDLYLLHWPNGVTNLSSVVTAFEALRSEGKIRRTRSASASWMMSFRSRTAYPNGVQPPIHMPFFRKAPTLLRLCSPMTS